MTRLFRLLLVVASAVVLITVISDSAVAQERIYVDNTTSEEATDIVNGQIVSTTSVELDGEVFRVSEIEVSSRLKGSLTGSIFVETPGGERSDGTVVFVSHTPRLVPGELVQLALTRRTDLSGAQLATAMGLSATVYPIVNGTEGAYGLLPDGIGRAAPVGDYVLSGPSWPDFAPPVGFGVNTANSGVSAAETITAVKRGFALWENDLGSSIDFVYEGTSSTVGLDPNDGHSTVSWVIPSGNDDCLPSDDDAWLAQASWIASGGDIIGFDVQMNRCYAWANGASFGRYDIGTVVGHEVGHGIGFGHAAASSELMYFEIASGQAKGLGPGDRSGLGALYPAPYDGPICNGEPVTVNLGTGQGSATEGRDVILGTDGNDWIWGFGGNDLICGGLGVDRIYAGLGNDVVFGGGGSDHIWGQAGADEIHGGSGADKIHGGSGPDQIFGNGGQDSIWGGDGNDEIQGNWESDKIWGGPGDDVLRGAEASLAPASCFHWPSIELHVSASRQKHVAQQSVT